VGRGGGSADEDAGDGGGLDETHFERFWCWYKLKRV
jgi:hypothetical protein